jgi:hypothetical protein
VRERRYFLEKRRRQPARESQSRRSAACRSGIPCQGMRPGCLSTEVERSRAARRAIRETNAPCAGPVWRTWVRRDHFACELDAPG